MNDAAAEAAITRKQFVSGIGMVRLYSPPSFSLVKVRPAGLFDWTYLKSSADGKGSWEEEGTCTYRDEHGVEHIDGGVEMAMDRETEMKIKTSQDIHIPRRPFT